MKIHLIPPAGEKLQDTRDGRKYSEVITDEKNRKFYVLVSADEEPAVIDYSNIHIIGE